MLISFLLSNNIVYRTNIEILIMPAYDDLIVMDAVVVVVVTNCLLRLVVVAVLNCVVFIIVDALMLVR
jgi:hypothetical protein